MGKEQGSVVGSGGGGGGSVGVIKIFPSLPTDRARISPDPS
jgi:hypothetical protein